MECQCTGLNMVLVACPVPGSMVTVLSGQRGITDCHQSKQTNKLVTFSLRLEPCKQQNRGIPNSATCVSKLPTSDTVG